MPICIFVHFVLEYAQAVNEVLRKRIGKLFVVNSYLPKMLLAALIGLGTGLVAIAFHAGLDFASSSVQGFFRGGPSFSRLLWVGCSVVC